MKNITWLGILIFLVACTPQRPIVIQPGPPPIIPPEEPTCKDLCGDGICQEFVCMAIGCPCAESPASCPQDCKAQIITNFDQCARAGYPIMESYPRQCRAEGKTFVEEAVTEVCRYAQDCGEGFFCRFGVCTEFTPDFSCKSDEDCQLINKEYGFGCCWIGRCGEIDYSQEQWIAVNANWFAAGHDQYCPTKAECGPAPMCPVMMTDENYAAKCVKGVCQKILTETN